MKIESNPAEISCISGRILICPLNWGMGHTARCIPLVKKYLKEGNEVFVAANPSNLAFIKREVPEIKHTLTLTGYQPWYPKHLPLWTGVAVSMPYLVFSVFKEHFLIKKILAENHIDVIISDNRYGLWNKTIRSIFITHQLNPVIPKPFRFAEKLLHRIIRLIIQKYDECWIPDNEGEECLSGILTSRNMQKIGNIKYISPLTRFSGYPKIKEKEKNKYKYDFMVILSGPKNARETLLKKVEEMACITGKKFLILCGNPNLSTTYQKNHHITFTSHLDTEAFYHALEISEQVIARSGYSTIMDLIYLRKKAVLVPTKGQTEQEYLASYHSGNPLFRCFSESNFITFATISRKNNDPDTTIYSFH